MSLKLYSAADVSQHNTATDCWMIIDGFVYDVTGFLKDHPGGRKILVDYAGTDATAAFHEVYGHDSDETTEMMSYLLVGKVGIPSPTTTQPPSVSINTISPTHDATATTTSSSSIQTPNTATDTSMPPPPPPSATATASKQSLRGNAMGKPLTNPALSRVPSLSKHAPAAKPAPNNTLELPGTAPSLGIRQTVGSMPLPGTMPPPGSMPSTQSSSAGSQLQSIRARNAEMRLNGQDSLQISSGSSRSTTPYDNSSNKGIAPGNGKSSSTLQIPGQAPSRNVEDLGLPNFSLLEVAHHCTEKDCWLAIDGVVYDVTAFLPRHPGGSRSIMRFAGRECSEDFHRITGHQFLQTTLLLEQMRVGVVRGFDHAAARARKEAASQAARERMQRVASGGNGPVSFKIDFTNKRVIMPGDNSNPVTTKSTSTSTTIVPGLPNWDAIDASISSEDTAPASPQPEISIPITSTLAHTKDNSAKSSTSAATTVPSRLSSQASLLCYPAAVQGTSSHAIVTLLVVDPALAVRGACPNAGTDNTAVNGQKCYCGSASDLLGWRHTAPQQVAPSTATPAQSASATTAPPTSPEPQCSACVRTVSPWPYPPLAASVRIPLGQHLSLTAWRTEDASYGSEPAVYSLYGGASPQVTHVSVTPTSSPLGAPRPCLVPITRYYTPLHTALATRDASNALTAPLSRYAAIANADVPEYVTMAIDLFIKPCGAASWNILDCAARYADFFRRKRAAGDKGPYFDILPSTTSHSLPVLPPLFLLSAPKGSFSCPSLVSGYFADACAVASGTGLAAPWPVLRRFLGVYRRHRSVHIIWAVADLAAAGLRVQSGKYTPISGTSKYDVPTFDLSGVGSPLLRDILEHLFCSCKACARRRASERQQTPSTALSEPCESGAFTQLKLTLVLTSLDTLATAVASASKSDKSNSSTTLANDISSPIPPSQGEDSASRDIATITAAPFASTLPAIRIVCGRIDGRTLPQLLPPQALSAASASTLRQQQLNNVNSMFNTDIALARTVDGKFQRLSSLLREDPNASVSNTVPSGPLWTATTRAALQPSVPSSSAAEDATTVLPLVEAGALLANASLTCSTAPDRQSKTTAAADPIFTSGSTDVGKLSARGFPPVLRVCNIPVYSLDFPILTAGDSAAIQPGAASETFGECMLEVEPVSAAASFQMSDNIETSSHIADQIVCVRTISPGSHANRGADAQNVVTLVCGSDSFNVMAEGVLNMQNYASNGPKTKFVFQ